MVIHIHQKQLTMFQSIILLIRPHISLDQQDHNNRNVIFGTFFFSTKLDPLIIFTISLSPQIPVLSSSEVK